MGAVEPQFENNLHSEHFQGFEDAKVGNEITEVWPIADDTTCKLTFRSIENTNKVGSSVEVGHEITFFPCQQYFQVTMGQFSCQSSFWKSF